MNGKVHTNNLKLNFSLLRMALNSKYKNHKLRERDGEEWVKLYILVP